MSQPVCPRCEVDLVPREAGCDCKECGGVWFHRDAVIQLVARLQSGGTAHLASPYRPEALAPLVDTVRYCRCVICSELMNRTRLLDETRIVVDMCLSCGVWFDRDEIAHAIEYMTEASHGDKEHRPETGLAIRLAEFFRPS